jgi:hypothetical protein
MISRFEELERAAPVRVMMGPSNWYIKHQLVCFRQVRVIAYNLPQVPIQHPKSNVRAEQEALAKIRKAPTANENQQETPRHLPATDTKIQALAMEIHIAKRICEVLQFPGNVSACRRWFITKKVHT